MRVFFCLIAAMSMCASSIAADYGAFVVRDSDDVLVSGYKLSNAPLMSTNACADVGVGKDCVKMYRVIVNQSNYNDGWANLAQSKKDNAKQAAKDQRQDADGKFDDETKAMVKVLLTYMTQTGGTNTWAQFKKDFKVELNK